MRNKILLSAAVAGILASSVTAGAAGKYKCDGANDCQGQGGCKNPKMAKKYAAPSCKGQSFVMVKDEAACTKLKAQNAPAAAETPKG